jgi:diguanylate cyclase (GGDEF)-like protein
MDFAAHRATWLLLALAGYVVVTVALVVSDSPGLGLGHFYYLPISLVALVAGPLLGAGAGLLAGILYCVAILANTQVSSEMYATQTAVRLVAFVSAGVLIGWFSRRHRRVVTELSRLANRDSVTGLPNTREFEAAIDRRLKLGEPFGLLVGDVDELRQIYAEGRSHGDDALRRLADRLVAVKGRDEEVARVGGDEFAVLGALEGDDGRKLALELEQQLASGGESITFGWAEFPRDGENALALYRAADVRLYARKVARGFRRDPGRNE